MPFFTTFSAVAVLVGIASAVPLTPSKTACELPSPVVSLTGVTHSVTAGFNGLHFEPSNVVAEIGDIVQFEFLPMNHSVAQSSFAEPCVPLADETGFFAGFEFATKEGKNPDVFQIVVKDSKPIWYYCPQQKGGHCQAGMVGVINQNFNNQDATLAKFIELAALTKESVIPPWIQGGERIVNPNP
jgi:plastocyanin